jgi:hypothetical protein
VNNAGRSQRAAWEEVEPVVDRQLFELNVFSVVALSRVVLTYFAQCSPQLDGHIVVTSSLAGLIGAPFSPTYTGAKHALHVSYTILNVLTQIFIVYDIFFFFLRATLRVFDQRKWVPIYRSHYCVLVQYSVIFCLKALLVEMER